LSFQSEISKNKSFANILLVTVLIGLVLLITFAIAKTGELTAVFMMSAIIGLAVFTCCILFPLFGLYLVIAVAFFVNDITRLLDTEATLTLAVDVFTLGTFLGILFRKVVMREKFLKNCQHPIVFAYMVYAAYTVIQVFNPNVQSMEANLLIVRKFFVLLLFLYSVIQLFTDMERIKQFFKIWIAIALLTSFYACWQAWFGMPQYQLNFVMSNPLWVSLYSLDDGDFRKFSFLADPKEFGLLAAATGLITLIFFLTLKKDRKKEKILLFIATVIFSLGMSYSGTRTANFMLVMGIFMYILMTISNRKTLIFSSVVAVIFVIVMYGPIYGNTTINRLRTTFDFSKEESLQVRDINRHNIQPYMQSHPIGGGLGTTGILNLGFNSRHPLAGFPTDSGFLKVALETGWIGLIIQCIVYFLVLQQGIHAYYRSKNSYYKKFLLAATIALFSYVIAQYAQVAIGQAPGVFLFYGLIAVIIRLPQMEKANLSET